MLRRPRSCGLLLFGRLTGVAIAVYMIRDAFVVRTFSLSPVAFTVGAAGMQAVYYSAGMRRRRPAAAAL
ncbi:MAG: hypothetical protein JST33_07025 [Actinobacteria bacterium]|nr:hypothetical protein [Actinomycetota bacterium]